MGIAPDEIGQSDIEALVRSRLAEAEIHVAPEEFALFVMMYPLQRAKADRVFELDLEDQP